MRWWRIRCPKGGRVGMYYNGWRHTHTHDIKGIIQDQVTFDEFWMCFQSLRNLEMVGQHRWRGNPNLNGQRRAPPVAKPRTPATAQWDEDP